MEAVQNQNLELQMTVAELDNQLQQMLINNNINQQLEVNAIEEEEPEEEPSKIQGQSGIASGFIDEPRFVDGAHVVPTDELSDEESSVNQPVPAIPAVHDLFVFPEEMYDQITAGARHLGIDIDHIFSFHSPPMQLISLESGCIPEIFGASYAHVP